MGSDDDQKGPGGRPPHEPDDVSTAIVESMVMRGHSQEMIAEAVGIAEKTLRKHYREILDRGKEAADAQVVQTAYQMATDGKHAGMTRYWLNCNVDDWSAPTERREVDAKHEHSGDGVKIYLPDNGKRESDDG